MSSSAADTLLALSRHAFTSEMVVAALPVKKVEQRKAIRASLFFVLTKNRSRITEVTLHLVKKGDKADSYKRKKSWPLTELRLVDGCSDGDLDLELSFADGSRKRWSCFHHRDKLEWAERLLSTVRQARCQQTVKFANFPSSLGAGGGGGGGGSSAAAAAAAAAAKRRQAKLQGGDALGAAFAIQADDPSGKSADDPGGFDMLTESESRDLQAFLDSQKESVQNAENFVRRLNEQLRSLELSNIHALISSGAQVTQLTDHVNTAGSVVEQSQNRVREFAGRLEGVAPAIGGLADRDKVAKLSAANQLKAAELLSKLLSDIRFDEADRRLLQEANFANPACVPNLLRAARQCDAVLGADVPPELRAMEAVRSSTAGLTELKKSFAAALVHHVNNIFVAYGLRHTQSRPRGHLSFPNHAEDKRELLQFAQLMAWLKANNRDMFDELKKRYYTMLTKVYESESREVLEAARALLQTPQGKDKTRPGTLRHTGSSSSLHREGSKRSSVDHQPPMGEHQLPPVAGSVATMGPAGATLDTVFDKLLDALEPLVDTEENFCQEFFELQQPQQTASLTASITSVASSTDESSSGPSSSLALSASKQELDELLKAIFQSVVVFLDGLVGTCYAASPDFSMPMLVRAAQRSERQTGRQRFLGHLYAQLCLRAKQRFDQCVEQTCSGFLEFKPNKKARCGILPCVKSYEDFAGRAAAAFRESKRLPDLERAHEKLLDTLVGVVERVAQEHGKTPPAVVLMENFHRLESIVRSQRMQRLDRMRKELSDRFKQNRTEYVKTCLGRPLEKLSEFFDGVEHSLARGVKPDEVGYLQQYSRGELKRLIKEYPAKDVKRGLEQLRKKVEKHLCEEESLFVAVWHEMQQAFLAQYNQFNKLIAQCYPNASLALDFSVSDLLRFFDEIANRAAM